MFKLHPSIITPDNLHSNIVVSSLLESPLDTLYHALQKVFGPILVKEGTWSRTIDPKIQDLVTQLEAGLGTVMRRQNKEGVAKVSGGQSEEHTLGIITPSDEYQFWVEIADTSTKLTMKERAQFFQEQLQSLATEFANLDSLSFADAMEQLDKTQDILNDIWEQTDHNPYPESRMVHLLEVISGSVSRYVQRKLSELDYWSGQFNQVHTSLQDGLMVCERWSGTCEALTTKFWKHWKGGPFVSEILTQLSNRIEEVM